MIKPREERSADTGRKDPGFFLERSRFEPAYLKTHEEGRLKEKAEEAVHLLEACTVCPRSCRINRLEGKTSVCQIGRYARVASFSPHHGEEDALRGRRGSGTIFFSGCNLKCVFCQNCDISQQAGGRDVTAEELARIMVRLQDAGCHNINLVTPEHVVPQILEALPLAVEKGLRRPVVYNTGGYDGTESIRLMDGVADIYMPDFKMWDRENCRRYLMAPDYADHAKEALKAMHGQVGELKTDEEGIALRGVLVRHLVMPGLLEDTKQIMDFVADEVSKDTYLNMMDQYYPSWRVNMENRYAALRRRINPQELKQAYDCAREAGLWRFDMRWL